MFWYLFVTYITYSYTALPLYSVILLVLDPRKCEYLIDYSLDFEHAYTRAVQKVSDLNFFRLNKSSMGSVLHCGCGGDINAHAWISSRLQIASVTGSRSMIVYVLWALGRLSIIAKWRNELSSVIALNFAKSLAILKLKLFERFNRLSGTMPWVSHE